VEVTPTSDAVLGAELLPGLALSLGAGPPTTPGAPDCDGPADASGPVVAPGPSLAGADAPGDSMRTAPAGWKARSGSRVPQAAAREAVSSRPASRRSRRNTMVVYHARAHMEAMSLSTRSSTERNGSLQRTVR
jgi:hypothetical protein